MRNFYTHSDKSTGLLCFQNKHNKEADLTGLQQLIIPIQISKSQKSPASQFLHCVQSKAFWNQFILPKDSSAERAGNHSAAPLPPHTDLFEAL